MISNEEAHQIADKIADLRREEVLAVQKAKDAHAVWKRAENIRDGIQDSIKRLKERLAEL